MQTEGEGLEKDIHANRNQKKAGVSIIISDKIDKNKHSQLIFDKKVRQVIQRRKDILLNNCS